MLDGDAVHLIRERENVADLFAGNTWSDGGAAR
jgi:hypothetical protein